MSVSKLDWLHVLISNKMKIFVALILSVIAAVIAKDLRIDFEPELGIPASGMAWALVASFYNY